MRAGIEAVILMPPVRELGRRAALQKIDFRQSKDDIDRPSAI
jgi:hypothetical protein